VLFDSNEKFLVSMRYCAADKLPVKILADKKINFRDCEILSVNEVSNRVNKNYYILMQNKKYIYRVRYTQGCEFDIIEKFKRQ
jgi:hypothetical protein